jgi:hypothetical protein
VSYNPTPSDAIGAYMTVAAEAYRVPVDFIDQPRQADVAETTPGNFLIHPSQGLQNPDKAVCTYDEQAQLWTVELYTGEMMQVRADGKGFVLVR